MCEGRDRCPAARHCAVGPRPPSKMSPHGFSSHSIPQTRIGRFWTIVQCGRCWMRLRKMHVATRASSMPGARISGSAVLSAPMNRARRHMRLRHPSPIPHRPEPHPSPDRAATGNLHHGRKAEPQIGHAHNTVPARSRPTRRLRIGASMGISGLSDRVTVMILGTAPRLHSMTPRRCCHAP